MPISVPVAMLIGTAVSGGAQVASNVMNNRAQTKAFEKSSDAERYAFDKNLELERERAAEERRRYDAEQAAKAAEAERRKPYEALRFGAMAQLAKNHGVNLPPDFLAAFSGANRSAPAPVPAQAPIASPVAGQTRFGAMANGEGQATNPGMRATFGGLGAAVGQAKKSRALPGQTAAPQGQSFADMAKMAQMMEAGGVSPEELDPYYRSIR